VQKELKKRISEDGSIIAAWSIDDIFGDVPAEHASLDEKVGHQTGENKVTNKSDNLKVIRATCFFILRKSFYVT
jgi:hypothetical protein